MISIPQRAVFIRVVAATAWPDIEATNGFASMPPGRSGDRSISPQQCVAIQPITWVVARMNWVFQSGSPAIR